MYKIIAFFLLLLAPCCLRAQVSPAEWQRLNYRIIGFSFPGGKAGGKYKLEIAEGTFHNNDSFRKKIVASYSSNKNRIVGEVPAFGKPYTWRVTTMLHDKESRSAYHHFTTETSASVDTSITRLRIVIAAKKHKNDYVFLDATRTLYNMKGEPVWFLPDIEGKPVDSFLLGDMKLTPQGTITYMSDRKNGTLYEVNYNGDILWKTRCADVKDTASDEHFHHEFSRLASGHYMALGTEFTSWKLPRPLDSIALRRPDIKDLVYADSDNNFYQHMLMSTVIEYDEQGKIIWRWRSADYFKPGVGAYYATTNMGIYEIGDPHLNSFYFDEKEQAVYLGFREMSRVVKISYPRGKVLAEYGTPYRNGYKNIADDLFCWQHSVRHSPNGYIYMFDNNTCRHKLPKISLIKDPTGANDTIKKIWEYDCIVDDGEKNRPYVFPNGGNVVELPDSAIFANMSCEVYTKVFIVSRAKELVWSAIPERKKGNGKWFPIFQYRADIIDKKSLQQLIWNKSNNK